MDAVLLYGATGYSGRLIAALARQRWSGATSLRVIVAGRDGRALRDLANELDVEYRTFALDDAREIDAGLRDVVTVINAAGPFALTAEPLAKAALRSGCHYVDINGEVDVYKRLDDLGYLAAQRALTMVCGAGHSAVASDLLLEGALRSLTARRGEATTPFEIGAVRIALSRVDAPSRGSLQTALRTVREQVLVVRDGPERNASRRRGTVDHLVLTYVPLGQLERVFDFGAPRDSERVPRSLPARRIACAVNLVDTLTARLTVARHVDRVLRIESYLESSETLRVVHQWAALTVPFWWISAFRNLGQQQIGLLPDGPTPTERARERLSVVVEIEDLFGQPLVAWRLETPSAYDFTAASVVTIAGRVSQRVGGLTGWRTPAEFLIDEETMIDPYGGGRLSQTYPVDSVSRPPLGGVVPRGCTLHVLHAAKA